MVDKVVPEKEIPFNDRPASLSKCLGSISPELFADFLEFIKSIYPQPDLIASLASFTEAHRDSVEKIKNDFMAHLTESGKPFDLGKVTAMINALKRLNGRHNIVVNYKGSSATVAQHLRAKLSPQPLKEKLIENVNYEEM